MMNQIGVRTIRRFVPMYRDIMKLRTFSVLFDSGTSFGLPTYRYSSYLSTATTTTTTTTNDRRMRYFTSAATSTDKSSSDSDTTMDDEDVIPKKKKVKSKRQEISDAFESEYKSIYNRSKTIYIKLCYTDHDVEEGDIVKAKFHWDSIVNITSEEFGLETTNGKLEYYANEDWVKLVPYRLYEVLQFYPCTRKQPLPLRVPSLYDEEYGTRNDLMKLKKVTPEMRKKQKAMVQMGPSAQQWLMKDVIEGIIKKFKVEGYTRLLESTAFEAPKMSFTYHDTDGSVQQVEMYTRDCILDLAREAPWRLPTPEEERAMEDAKYKAQGTTRPGSRTNPMGMHNQKNDPSNDPDIVLKKLKHVLLTQPGALDHIVECLHYEHMWS